ncbi:YibE/F family protein [Luteimicrobium xylanilyticum]|uniref:YibE/F family protein n=1 Tax=Luteimicrobium xylanilyticum TaxID=1133546 RepID=UPI001D15A93D
MSSPRHAERPRPASRPEGHAHGHGHSHDPALAASVPTTTRSSLVVLVCLVPVLLATVLGAALLWPQGDKLPHKIEAAVPGAAVLHATVLGPADSDGNVPVRVTEVGAPSPDPTAKTRVAKPPVKTGQKVSANAPTELVQYGFKAGQKVTVMYLPAGAAASGDAGTSAGSGGTAGSDGDGSATSPADGSVDLADQSAYSIVDFDRSFPVGLLALTFAVLVVVVARWRGLAALAGLGITLLAVAFFTVPALLEGRSALGVALVTAVAVMFATLYLAHGFSVRTSTALLGTLAGIAITGVVAWWASGAAQVTGATSEESYWLPSQAHHVSLAGVALCGMLLAGLGALNDVTITQASSVWELRALAPDASRRSLFTSALRIGRDHIASTVYTIAFAYLGASLPLLLAVWLQEQPLSLSLTTGSVVEEIVRTLVGMIGLVLAVPLTTAIAAACVPGGPATERSPANRAAGAETSADGAAVPVDSAAAMDPAEVTFAGTGQMSDSEFWSDRRGRA